MSLRRLPFHRVLYRPGLFLGGEREPAMLTAIVAGSVAGLGMNTVSFVVGAVLWFGSIPLFRWMAKADPQMVKVWQRHRKYRGYYSARSRPAAGDTMDSGKQWAVILAACTAILVPLCFHYGVL